MSQTTTVRSLQPADVDAVVRIDRERSGRARTEFYGRRFQAFAQEPGSVVAVAAERDGRVAGFAFARVLDGEFGGAAPVGALDAIGVPPAAERGGVATALLGAVEEALARRGARELRSQVDWTDHGLAAFFASAGFRLSPRVVLERGLDRPADVELDPERLLLVRSMTEADVPAIVRVDRKITGRDRAVYLGRKAREVLVESAIRMSLVAELEGQVAGFLMARVDFGEFGRTEPTAVLDTIGVDPDYRRQAVGHALLEQLLLNLGSLRVERVLTEVEWSQLGLLGFLQRNGFAPAQRIAFDKPIG